jgi:redox-sensitive bicupin YhaK (pirin superfamily)
MNMQKEVEITGPNVRTVERLVRPETASDGAGVVLKRAIGSLSLSYADPFLLLDHFGSDDPDDYIAGFPMHPHRGIETVTYVLSGSVKHRDSEGNEGIIRAGGVQWMTAGSGIIHEEMPQLEGGQLEGFQLWVNLPAASKMMKPRYSEFGAEEIPLVNAGPGVSVKVIAGEYMGVGGAVTGLEAAPSFLDVSLDAGAGFDSAVSSGRTAFVYIYRGSLVTGGGEQGIDAPGLALLSDGDSLIFTAGMAGASFLLVHGNPLDEPIARYGPFVMNTKEEIRTALNEISRGDFIK